MQPSEALSLLLAALTPFIVIWVRSRTKKIQMELEDDIEAVTEPRRPIKETPPAVGTPYLAKMVEDLTRKVDTLGQQLDAAMKTIDQYRNNEERLIARLAEVSVNLRIAKMENDKLYEHIYSNIKAKVGSQP